MNQQAFPVIKIEFESMRHTLRTAMTQQMARIDTDIQAAIDRYCTAENLQAIIDENVRSSVNAAVKEEIQNLFRHSAPGRAAIKEAIEEFAKDYWGEQ